MIKKEFWFESINSNVKRMSIGSFNMIIDNLFPKNTDMYFFGVKQNLFWKPEKMILEIRKEIQSDFNQYGYYKIIHSNKGTPLFSVAKINSFDFKKIDLVYKFWDYFEVVFILNVHTDISVVNMANKINFEFKQYEKLLNIGEIKASICKSENDLLCVDSKNIEIFEPLKAVVNCW